MTDHNRYKIIFDGQLNADMTFEMVKNNLARLFKSTPEAVANLFSGAPVTIKRDLSSSEADKYLNALHQAGALARKEPEVSLSLVEHISPAETLKQPQMSCPKCGHTQNQADVCSACGIVIQKYLARQQTLEATANTETSPYSAPQAELYEEHSSAELKVWGISRRVGRVRYIARLTAMYIVFGIAVLIAISSAGTDSEMGAAFIGIVGIGVFVAIFFAVQQGVQRLHDIGWSGWLLLISLIPVIGNIFPLLLMIIPGTSGSNQYGPPPPANTLSVIILASILPLLVIVSFIGSFMLAFSQ